MGSNYDEEYSNEESSKGNDSSLIVNVNDTHSDIENHSNYSRSDDYEEDDDDEKSNDSRHRDSGYKKTKRNDSSYRKKSPAKDPKSRGKVDPQNSRYLWVSGVPIGTKTTQLEEFFSKHGKVLAIKIIRGGNMSLLGFVKLETVDQAKRCMNKLNKTMFRGKKVEISKERPVDNEETAKIGFQSRKFLAKPPISSTSKRPFHSSHRGSFRGAPNSMSPRTPRIDRGIDHDIRRQEREEVLRLERERQKLKLERMKLEREKAEVLKLERESRYQEPPPPPPMPSRSHDEKRVRSMIKRPPYEDSFVEEKHYDDFKRREEFSMRRYDSRHEPRGGASPERKISSRPFVPSGGGPSSRGGGRYEDNHGRHERYSDHKSYDSNKNWQTMSDNSWMNTSTGGSGGGGGGGGGGDRWNSSSSFEVTPRIVSSSIGSNSMSRIHSNTDHLSPNMSSRNHYFNRRY